MQIAYIAIYVLLAYYAHRWNRGVLPVAAALAVLLMIFAAVAAPGWFDRDKGGIRAADDRTPASSACSTLLIIPARSSSSRSRCGASNRAGTSSSNGVTPTSRPSRGPREATPPPPTPPERRLSSPQPRCGGGGTVDAGPSKGPVRKGVWVRFPPAASRQDRGRASRLVEPVEARLRPSPGYVRPRRAADELHQLHEFGAGDEDAPGQARARRARPPRARRVRRSAPPRRCPTPSPSARSRRPSARPRSSRGPAPRCRSDGCRAPGQRAGRAPAPGARERSRRMRARWRTIASAELLRRRERPLGATAVQLRHVRRARSKRRARPPRDRVLNSSSRFGS